MFLSFCFCKKLSIIPKQPFSVRANKAVSSNESKSNLLLYSLYYSEASNKFAGPSSASLHLGYTAPFEEMLQLWRAVSNTVSDLTGSRFEPLTSRSRETRYRSTNWPVLNSRKGHNFLLLTESSKAMKEKAPTQIKPKLLNYKWQHQNTLNYNPKAWLCVKQKCDAPQSCKSGRAFWVRFGPGSNLKLTKFWA